jgi:hypothetical protein
LTLVVVVRFGCRVTAIGSLLGLDGVTAELVAQGSEDLGAVRVVLARPETRQQ